MLGYIFYLIENVFDIVKYKTVRILMNVCHDVDTLDHFLEKQTCYEIKNKKHDETVDNITVLENDYEKLKIQDENNVQEYSKTVKDNDKTFNFNHEYIIYNFTEECKDKRYVFKNKEEFVKLLDCYAKKRNVNKITKLKSKLVSTYYGLTYHN
jgi:hypothetical protein